jgi:hypothetical protein
LPIDGDSSAIVQAIAQQRAAAGQRIPSRPHFFYVGTDAASQRVIAALGAQPMGTPGSGPAINLGGGANVRIGGGARITIGGQRLEDVVAQAAQAAQPPAAPPPLPPLPRPSTAQRLQELETLRATGAVSDDEYTSKRAEIISEI